MFITEVSCNESQENQQDKSSAASWLVTEVDVSITTLVLLLKTEILGS